MKNYDCELAEYIKYNNESWKIIKENTKLLENFSACIVNLANDSRIMGSQRTINVIMEIDSDGKLNIATKQCDTTTSDQ